jgi:hypothetical protein
MACGPVTGPSYSQRRPGARIAEVAQRHELLHGAEGRALQAAALGPGDEPGVQIGVVQVGGAGEPPAEHGRAVIECEEGLPQQRAGLAGQAGGLAVDVLQHGQAVRRQQGRARRRQKHGQKPRKEAGFARGQVNQRRRQGHGTPGHAGPHREQTREADRTEQRTASRRRSGRGRSGRSGRNVRRRGGR